MDDQPPTVSVAEAAARLGMSEATVRRRIKERKIAAFRRPIPGGYEWRVTLPADDPLPTSDSQPPINDDQHPIDADDEIPTTDDHPPTSADTRLAVVVRPLLDAMERERSEERAQFLDALARARQEVGFYQGMLLAQLARDEPPDAVQSPPTEDVSHTAATPDAPTGIWARVVAWWRGGA